MFERSKKGERALLIQPFVAGQSDPAILDEFAELTRSAGAQVAGTLSARIDKANPATLIGIGKVEEALSLCAGSEADLVLVNHTLTPVQERNLERALQRRVVDRTGLILDIFAQRARSHEGKLQVELAQLKHMATRLVRGWTHLERQRGGSIGLRGPGETQLETDRRLLAKRVDALKSRLEKVEVQRTQMRRARLRNGLARVALVGYTNAGKSTLFNALTRAGIAAAGLQGRNLERTARGDAARRILVLQRIEGGAHEVVRVRRAERLRDHVLHADRLEDGAHRAAGDDAGAGRGSAQDDLAGAVAAVDVMVQRAAIAQRDADEAALGGFRRLADRLRHFTGLAVAEADAALLVADDDEGSEAEATAALHHLGDAVDVDQAVHEFRITLFAVLTVTRFSRHVFLLLARTVPIMARRSLERSGLERLSKSDMREAREASRIPR